MEIGWGVPVRRSKAVQRIKTKRARVKGSHCNHFGFWDSLLEMGRVCARSRSNGVCAMGSVFSRIRAEPGLGSATKNAPKAGCLSGRFSWSGRRDLNPRRQPWQGCTLPLSYSRKGAGFPQRPRRLHLDVPGVNPSVGAGAMALSQVVFLRGRAIARNLDVDRLRPL